MPGVREQVAPPTSLTVILPSASNVYVVVSSTLDPTPSFIFVNTLLVVWCSQRVVPRSGETSSTALPRSS